MDELARPTSSTSSPPSPASFFSAAHSQVLEFLSSEVPEQWLLDDDDLPAQGHAAAWGADVGSDLSGGIPPEAAPRRRGRRHLPRSDGPAVSHVEAERQRRDKLHRRFCDLRAAVPTVSRMDKASLLADATAYITELRARVEQLEVEVSQAAAWKATARPAAAGEAAATSSSGHRSLAAAVGFEEEEEEKLEVRMVGSDAASLRLTTTAAARHGHAPARLMGALRALDLHVQHASVCRVGGVTVQDAVVDVPAAALRDQASLRANLLHRLRDSSG
ncbi:hypothetical protein EJB05_47862, partial [Eragrostis curvula]